MVSRLPSVRIAVVLLYYQEHCTRKKTAAVKIVPFPNLRVPDVGAQVDSSSFFSCLLSYFAAATVVDRVVASPHRRRCCPTAVSMGVKSLLKELPGGNMKEQRIGFATLVALQ